MALLVYSWKYCQKAIQYGYQARTIWVPCQVEGVFSKT